MSNDIKYPKDYSVGWEPWIDAYDQELEEQIIEEEFDEEDLADLGLEHLGQMKPIIKSIMTPFGILPLTEQSLASRHFKFWVGHTNFMLGDGKNTSLEEFESLIGDVLGVETVDILTSYRFRVGIGKLFQDREVMDNVKNILVSFIKSRNNGKQTKSGSK